MTWDLTSYVPRFDGPEMRLFKEALRSDVASLQEQAAALRPLTEENADTWEQVFQMVVAAMQAEASPRA